MKSTVTKLLYRNRFTEDERKDLLHRGYLVHGDNHTAYSRAGAFSFKVECIKKNGSLRWNEE